MVYLDTMRISSSEVWHLQHPWRRFCSIYGHLMVPHRWKGDAPNFIQACKRCGFSELAGCARCDEAEGIDSVPALTAYIASLENPTPNRPILLCPECAQDHRNYWQERWDEYYSGRS